ncbi:MAG: tRNA (adenosine(37)-N6)-threonylcarbamoyltransferase complex dimerization subunit type 1 TsaB [Planctomycetota bacterium]
MAGILAFEAVTRGGSACYWQAGSGCLAERAPAGPSAAGGLVPALCELLRGHPRPQALALAVGPGSFTGLRIAVVAARTLGWLEDLPVHPVDTLGAIAAAAGPGTWWVWQPLKRDTTFHGVYEVGETGPLALVPPCACADATPPGLPELAQRPTVIGPALEQKPELAAVWAPDAQLGSAQAVSARGVALAALAYPAIGWRALEPQYCMPSAPELQRAAAGGGG